MIFDFLLKVNYAFEQTYPAECLKLTLYTFGNTRTFVFQHPVIVPLLQRINHFLPE